MLATFAAIQILGSLAFITSAVNVSSTNETEIEVVGFGFTTAEPSNSGHNDAVTLTLYWNSQILQCVIPENSGGYNSNFTCNETPILQIGTNDAKEYKIKIHYDHSSLFRPSGVHVVDKLGNNYIINEFCGPIQYYYWDNANPNPSQCVAYFNDVGRFRYDYLEIATNTAFLTTLYVSFIDDILSHPNQALPGAVSPAKVTKFGVHTSLDENSGNPLKMASLRLFWDLDLYLCDILLYEYNTTYVCDVNTDQVKTHCYDNKIFINKTSNESLFVLLIENDDSNGVYIDNVFVIDETDYYYGIDTFCVSDSNIVIGREGNLATVCPEWSALNKYNEICIDSDACGGNIRLSIEFGKDLFQNPNAEQQGIVYPVAQFNDVLCDNTLNPSGTPTKAPIVPTVAFPSIAPTDAPSIAPTKDIAVQSFGFKTHHYSNSGANDDVVVTLHWKDILQCTISSANVPDTYFFCDASNIRVIAKDVNQDGYKMKLYYNHSSLFRVSEVIVIDLNDNYYRVDTFCGAKNFYYWDGATDQEVFCDNDYFPLKYNYSYIELATSNSFVTSVYIDFVYNILDHPNKNMSAELRPEYVQSFGFKTGTNSWSAGDNQQEIVMNLHWNTYRYQCSVVANASNTLYLCDESNIILCDDAANKIMPEFKIYVENSAVDQLEIDQMFVKDLSGYFYGIDTFCIQSSLDSIGRATNSNNCTESGYTQYIQYEYICIQDDPAACATSLAVEYRLDLFLNPNVYQEGIVSVNNNSLLDALTCAPTKSPTLSPTFNPAMIQILEFGVITHWFSNSGPDADVLLTLFWEYQIFECVISANKKAYNTSLHCNSTQFTFVGYSDTKEYKMKLFYNHPYLFRPTALFVTDIIGNKYTVNEFCGPKQFYYWDASDEFKCTPYYSNRNKYSYEYLELATNTAFLTTLYVDFVEDILLKPNVNLPGLVYPAAIANFGLMTSNDINAGNPSEIAALRLYWDEYLYLCSLRISDPNTKYICNVSNTTQVKTHCFDELNSTNMNTTDSISSFRLLVQNDDRNGIYVDSVFVIDESGYNYGIDTFCLNDSNIDIGRTAIGQKCTDFYDYGSLSEYNEICIDRNNCGNNVILCIDFSLNLFQNPNSEEQGFVTPISELNALKCTETDAPTPSPSKSPITPTNPLPSASPTLVPTYSPTVSAKIKSFGFKTYRYSNSGHNSDVYVTLWWMNQKFACIIPEKTNGTDFDEYFYCSANKNKFRMIAQELTSDTFKMKLRYEHSSLLRVSEVLVIDVDDNKYRVNTFCGAQEFYFWDTKNEILCNNGYFPLKYNYSYIELSSLSLTTIYIEFVADVLKHANVSMTSELRPESIESFGFKTGLDAYSGGTNESAIKVRLYWDTYRYQCALIAVKYDTLYLCDVDNDGTESCDIGGIDTDFAILIENDHSNQLQIDEILVKDLSGHYYGIEDFCVSPNISYVGRDSNDINCSSNNKLLEYDLICIENDKTCSKKARIQFNIDLFQYPNAMREGAVLLRDSDSLEEFVCTNNPTLSPTDIPTTYPINEETIAYLSTMYATVDEKDSERKQQSVFNQLLWLWILLAVVFVAIVIVVICCIESKKPAQSDVGAKCKPGFHDVEMVDHDGDTSAFLVTTNTEQHETTMKGEDDDDDDDDVFQ